MSISQASKYLFLLLHLTSSCATSSPWCLHEVKTECEEYNSASLASIPSNRFTGIEVQFLKGNAFGMRCYLNVFSREVPLLAGQCKESSVVIDIEGMKYPFTALRMDGGQRLLLSEEAASLIVSSLIENKKVCVHLEGFIAELSSAHFSSYWTKMQRTF